MRRSTAFAAFAAALTLVGCDEYAWERPGTSGVVRQNDDDDCRQQVRNEAFRSYAFYSGFPIMGPAYWGFRQQPDYSTWRAQLEREPLFYHNRLAHFCMRNKGYTLVKLETVTATCRRDRPTQRRPPACGRRQRVTSSRVRAAVLPVAPPRSRVARRPKITAKATPVQSGLHLPIVRFGVSGVSPSR